MNLTDVSTDQLRSALQIKEQIESLEQQLNSLLTGSARIQSSTHPSSHPPRTPHHVPGGPRPHRRRPTRPLGQVPRRQEVIPRTPNPNLTLRVALRPSCSKLQPFSSVTVITVPVTVNVTVIFCEFLGYNVNVTL